MSTASKLVVSVSRYPNQATQRVLQLLAVFCASDQPRGVSELSRETGTNKNMVHRILSTLVEAGYVVRDPSGERYQLGYRILNLHTEDHIFDLREIGRPVLEKLHSMTKESVFLSIIVGANRVNVDWIEGKGRRVSFGERGRSVPLHHSVMSRFLLAHLQDRDIESYLIAAEPLDQFDSLYPDAPASDRKAIWTEVHEMRGKPYLIWRSPKQFGGAYIAFPLPGANGLLHGIVTIGGPIERFDPALIINNPNAMALVDNLQRVCRSVTPLPVVLTDRGRA